MKIFRLIGAVIWAIPVYFLWNYLAPIYLAHLPPQYLDVPFWHIAGVFVLLKIVKMMIFPSHRGHYYACGWGKFRKLEKLRRFAHGRCGGISDTYYHR